MPQILHRMPSDLCMQKPAHPWHSFLYFFFLPWEARSHHPHSSGFAHLRLQLSFFFHQTHFPSAGETSYVRRDMSSPYVCLLDTELLRVSPHSEALSGTAGEALFLLEYEPSGKRLQTQRWHTGWRYWINKALPGPNSPRGQGQCSPLAGGKCRALLKMLSL